MASIWGRRGRRDPRQARFLTLASLRWVVRHRAWTPWYLVRYARLLRVRLTHPHVVLRGIVFLGKGVELHARPGHGRLEIGPWVHIGDGSAIRCHEGSLRIGEKVVLGRQNTVNCYLDVEIGAATIVADWVYVTDFDHITSDVRVRIKDQGIVKTPVRIGPDCWIGVKASVLRGTRVGQGAVLGAHAVVRGDVPPYSVAVGVPARVVRDRLADDEVAQPASVGDVARTQARAVVERLERS